MAVPGSGPLKLRGDIALEVDGTDTGTNVSLQTLSIDAGFSTPYNFSNFYGYISAVAPSVSTSGMSSVTATSMTLNGNVTSDGGGTVSERGFYFGTNSSSPTNNTKYTVGSGTGGFSTNRTGLSSTTTYYAWAYATNEAGTTYGSRQQATTEFNYTFAPGAFYEQTSNVISRTYYQTIAGGFAQKASWTGLAGIDQPNRSNTNSTNRLNKYTTSFNERANAQYLFIVRTADGRSPSLNTPTPGWQQVLQPAWGGQSLFYNGYIIGNAPISVSVDFNFS